MSDIQYTYNMSVRRTSTDVVSGPATGYKVVAHTATIELPAAAANATIKIGTFPARARLCYHSDILNDQLANTGSPTLEIGISSVNGNMTAVPNAINDSIALSSASATKLLKDYANAGKRLWELAGLAVDPKGEVDIYATVIAAPTNIVATILSEILYVID